MTEQPTPEQVREKIASAVPMTPNPEPVAQADLVERLTGRARFCRDRGEIKTPELLEGAAAELTRLRAEIARKDEALRVAQEFVGRHCARREGEPISASSSPSLRAWNDLDAALKEPNQ